LSSIPTPRKAIVSATLTNVLVNTNAIQNDQISKLATLNTNQTASANSNTSNLCKTSFYRKQQQQQQQNQQQPASSQFASSASSSGKLNRLIQFITMYAFYLLVLFFRFVSLLEIKKHIKLTNPK
jgi:preprotein translocase subunit SecF